MAEYAGNYVSPYLGEAKVTVVGDGLQLTLGARGQQSYPLIHWDADSFSFVPLNDAAPPDSVSAADFTADGLRLEHFDHDGLGLFSRAP